MSEQTTERERMLSVLVEAYFPLVCDLTERLDDEVRPWYEDMMRPLRDALIAEGFGDVSAERAEIENLKSVLRMANASTKRRGEERDAERERVDRAEIDTRRKIAQEVHDWAALHAGPEGSYAARIIENRIREKLPKDGTEDQPAAAPEKPHLNREVIEAQEHFRRMMDQT